MIIWRDDDAPIHKLSDFMYVHELLRSYNVVHTVALICRSLDKYQDFIDYVKSDPDYFDLQFHCLDHIDHVKNVNHVREQFREGIRIFESVFHKRPAVWYPTWNSTNIHCNDIAEEFGMKVSYEKFSLGQYIRRSEAIEEGVINFHHWAGDERELLKPALEIYANSRTNS